MHTALKKSPVMVLHWVIRESNYAIWNCKSRSTFEVHPSYGLALGVLRVTPCVSQDETSET